MRIRNAIATSLLLAFTLASCTTQDQKEQDTVSLEDYVIESTGMRVNEGLYTEMTKNGKRYAVTYDLHSYGNYLKIEEISVSEEGIKQKRVMFEAKYRDDDLIMVRSLNPGPFGSEQPITCLYEKSPFLGIFELCSNIDVCPSVKDIEDDAWSTIRKYKAILQPLYDKALAKVTERLESVKDSTKSFISDL